MGFWSWELELSGRDGEWEQMVLEYTAGDEEKLLGPTRALWVE